ncbi:hypothetical protein AYI68_g2568 [Smittium mucronatum]|uniref:CCHC-type domain-containing protein n=1 Tax=Smittium mucronatum TaxID=133383 RepID=A0A1R0H2C2_9FUNG|nr:hypothetical protein AYI68_g2568 [Smittium mucronatum]
MDIKVPLVCRGSHPVCKYCKEEGHWKHNCVETHGNIAGIAIKEKGTYENPTEVDGGAEGAQGDTLYHDILLSIKEDPKVKINQYESLKNNGITNPEVKDTTNITDRSDISENDKKYISKLPIIENENEIESEDEPRRKPSSYLDRSLSKKSNVRIALNERE